jgi:HK97 family phage major capsid protein
MSDFAALKNLLEDQNNAFASFKEANDERLKALEKGKTDPLIDAKVEKANEDITAIGQQMDDLQSKINRQGFGGGDNPEDKAKAEYGKAFNAFARKGIIQDALTTGSDPDGGYAVPEELDRSILDLLRDENPMRRLSMVMTLGTPDYKKLVNVHGAGSGWVGEEEARAETNTPALKQLAPFWGEIYANPAATQQMLEDSFFNVEAWLAAEVQLEFAEQENTAFTLGNGVKKPKGFLAYDTAATADASRTFGTIQHVVSGAAADFASSNPSDKFIDVVQAMKKGYRNGAVWMMNSLTVGKVRKFKDGQGNYLWQPSSQAGQPSTLMGYNLEENEDMPDVGAGALAVSFGNFKRSYTIVDRIGTTVLRDPFTNKPFVHFYTRKRVGGFLSDSNAVKVIKISA